MKISVCLDFLIPIFMSRFPLSLFYIFFRGNEKKRCISVFLHPSTLRPQYTHTHTHTHIFSLSLSSTLSSIAANQFYFINFSIVGRRSKETAVDEWMNPFPFFFPAAILIVRKNEGTGGEGTRGREQETETIPTKLLKAEHASFTKRLFFFLFSFLKLLQYSSLK